MLTKKRNYKKKYVIGGAGVFHSIGNFFCENLFEKCGKAISVDRSSGRKNCGKRYRNDAVHVNKTVAIDAGKKSVEKVAKRLFTLKSQMANVMVPPEEITKTVNQVIAKYIDTSAINLIKLIDESSVNHSTACNAIAIQDLVKRLNRSGLKIT